MSFFVILFWAWVAVSAVLLVSRLMGRHRTPSSSAATSGDAAPMSGVFDTGHQLHDPAPPVLDLSELDQVAGPPADPGDLDQVPAVAARVDLSDVPTPPPPAEPTTRTATLAELVQGISMPDDLVPLTHAGPTADDHVVLMSTTSEAADIGPNLADALEAIGMTIEPVSGNEIIATRPGQGSLHAAIHETPHTVLRNAGPAFPTAPVGSVVVELWTGSRPE